jgi:predicted ATPase
VIVATQSTTLLDQFTPEDVVVVERPMRPMPDAPQSRAGRATTMHRLDAAPLSSTTMGAATRFPARTVSASSIR